MEFRATPIESPDSLAAEIRRQFPGDIQDDDGQAIDEMFESVHSGPVEQVYVEGEKFSLPETTRIMSSTFPFTWVGIDGGQPKSPEPVMVLPPDPNRKMIRLSALMNGNPSDMMVGISDTKSGVYTPEAHTVIPYTPMELCHTGALWILPIRRLNLPAGDTLTVHLGLVAVTS